jgi:hypothetical protein
VVIVLAIGPKVRGFEHGRARWIFKGDQKIRIMTSFGEEVKPSATYSYRKILDHIKGPCRVSHRYFADKINGHFSPSISQLRY